MQRKDEVELTEELLDLHRRKSACLVEQVTTSSIGAYLDTERFKSERHRIFRRFPQPVAHWSELPEVGSFLRRDFAGLPVLITRDGEGVAHAFLNVCRHRGTRLVDAERGCRHRFSCPYHAWTYSNQGDLIGVPHEALGFSELDRQDFGLKRLGCAERYGWIWLSADDETPDVEPFLAGLGADFDGLAGADHALLHQDERVCAANWKIIVEGGIEAYHFRVAHRETIAPYFLDNLSTFREFGLHLRSILARQSLPELAEQPKDTWRLRDHAQVLYSIFPLNQLLVQSDHIAWIQSEPIDAASTRIRISTLAPRDRIATDDDLRHWARNHDITMRTLGEDFDIAESIQSGLASGANEVLTFGRFEGALAAFNREVDALLENA